MDLKIKGKSALISGSTAGIGLAIAQGLAAEGVRVYINGRTEERVGHAIKIVRDAQPDANLEGIAAALDTADGVREVCEKIGAVDILVNNLGIFESQSFESMTDADWQRYFDTNIMSGVRLSRALLPAMVNRNWGRILFISSQAALTTPPDMIHYGFTKAGQVAIARGLAAAVAGTGVTVNSVIVGPTRSEGVDKNIAMFAAMQNTSETVAAEALIKQFSPQMLLGRWAECAEVANMVLYLCSELSSATTGAMVRVDGGAIQQNF